MYWASVYWWFTENVGVSSAVIAVCCEAQGEHSSVNLLAGELIAEMIR